MDQKDLVVDLQRLQFKKHLECRVYAAMRYYCGEKDIYTEDDLECGMKYTDAPGVKLEDIMLFLKGMERRIRKRSKRNI